MSTVYILMYAVPTLFIGVWGGWRITGKFDQELRAGTWSLLAVSFAMMAIGVWKILDAISEFI